MRCFLTVSLFFTMMGLTGCVPLVIGGAAIATGTTISTVTDRRNVGTVINDKVLESKVASNVRAAVDNEQSDIEVMAYNGRVLICGVLPSEASLNQAVFAAKKTLDVQEVVNETSLGQPRSVEERLRDSKIATAVRSGIVADSETTLNQTKVVVYRATVYFMGCLTKQEDQRTAELISRIADVKRVVSLADILTKEQIQERLGAQ